MGIGAGGLMRQKIYPDEHGVETWDPTNRGQVVVHVVNSEAYREITGRAAPPTPVDARSYTTRGLPWFDLYDEHRHDLPASGRLAGVRGLAGRRADRGETPDPEDAPIYVPEWQVEKLHAEAEVESAQGSD
jgi:hypothetical protein